MLGCAGHDIRFHAVTCDIVYLSLRYRTGVNEYAIVVVNQRYRMHMISYVGPEISYFGHTISYIRYRMRYHIHTISYVRTAIS